MTCKSRIKPKALTVLEILDKRMQLDKEKKRRYFTLRKGYEGEVSFDLLTKKLKCECLILNDLLLTQNNTTFQTDTLIIAHGKIHLFEIKNNTGDHYYESDHMYHISGVKLGHPVHQLERSESLLQQLIYTLGHNYPIEASVVYINPSFTMYQAPRYQPIIYPTQIKNHLHQMNHTPSHITDKHIQLADQLIDLHQTSSRFEQMPEYGYDDVKKGMLCVTCHTILESSHKEILRCSACNHAEYASSAILRGIREFHLLFPEKKITTRNIYEWCEIMDKQRIKRILLKKFKRKGSGRWTYFEYRKR